MRENAMKNDAPVLWLDEQPISMSELMSVLRKEQKLPEIVKHLVMDRALENIKVEAQYEKSISKMGLLT